jgi:hypothetical protein
MLHGSIYWRRRKPKQRRQCAVHARRTRHAAEVRRAWRVPDPEKEARSVFLRNRRERAFVRLHADEEGAGQTGSLNRIRRHLPKSSASTPTQFEERVMRRGPPQRLSRDWRLSQSSPYPLSRCRLRGRSEMPAGLLSILPSRQMAQLIDKIFVTKD